MSVPSYNIKKTAFFKSLSNIWPIIYHWIFRHQGERVQTGGYSK